MIKQPKIMASINIQGLDKVALLEKLWKNQITAGFYGATLLPSPAFDTKAAQKAVTGYIDYFCGRAIKTDISKDSVDPWLYDRDAGAGTFARIVDGMRTSAK